jgi:3,4-dihydroxy 2-butanone 4-phosphate synthase/GTP cyclohydrolase II
MNSAAATTFAEAHRIPITTLTKLTAHRLEREPIVTRTAEATIPTTLAGNLRAIVYRSKLHSEEHIALVQGEIPPHQPVLVRVQAENTLTDVFGSPRFNSRRHLHNSLRAINARGCGVLLYLRRFNFSDSPEPSTAATAMREYGVGAQILRDLGVSQIELLTSTPRSLLGLPSFGIQIVAQHPIPEYEGSSDHE